MTLTKDQKQKIVLGSMILCMVVYAYWEFMLTPLQRARQLAKTAIAEIEPQIAAAQKQIRMTATVENQAPLSEQLLAQINAMIPDGAAVAWVPPRINDFFKERSFDRFTSRMGAATSRNADKDLPGFKTQDWTVEATGEFVPLASAFAEFENREVLFEIQSFTVEAGREDAGQQTFQFNLTNIIRP